MKNNSGIVVWVIVALLVGGFIGNYAGMQKAPRESKESKVSTSTGISEKQVMFERDMRKLWEDHVTWTRLYIVETAAELEGADESAARLMKNQEDIGDAVKAYYGNDAGTKLTELLKVHIEGAVAVLDAAKAGDETALEAAKISWYANGDEIATFLSEANPQNWPLEDMKEGMKMHLDLTLDEAVAQLEGKYSDAVAAYDEVHDHILGLADLLSSGIIKQFPEKF